MFSVIFFFVGLGFGGFGTGLLCGFIGYIIDQIRAARKLNRFKEETNKNRYYKSEDQFEEEILVLIAYVARSDQNRLRQSELKYCKEYFQNNFPHSNLTQLFMKFKDYLDDSNLDSLCEVSCDNIKQYATTPEKIAVLQALFGFVLSDGNANNLELIAVQNISDRCGISRTSYEAVKALFFNFSYQGYYSQRTYRESYNDYNKSTFNSSSGPSLNECYKILEVSQSATDDEVKKAYRIAAMRHHPDKVSHLGEDVRKQAEEKFAKVNEAYDKIKTARGIK